MKDSGTLARALTLVESEGPGWEKVLAKAAKTAKPAARLGITGPPGAGKSTLVSKLVPKLKGPVGVVAVDPSSQFSGGAILGDRFRFENTGPGVFFRSVAHRGSGGGLSCAVRAMVTLLEAAGKRQVLLESVGVGQTELDILSLVDTVVVVLVPESGDYIQALKAGIMEAGDLLVVNKMDRDGAEMMKDELVDVLSYSKCRRFPDWRPKVLMTDAREGKGVDALLAAIGEHRSFLAQKGRMRQLRLLQGRQAVEGLLKDRIERRISEDPSLVRAMEAAGARVAAGKADPYAEAGKLVRKLLKGGKA